MKQRSGFAGIMTAPTILVLAVLTIFPLLFTLFYSFTDYYFLAKSSPEFVGFRNYIDLFQNPYFRQAIWNTIRFVLYAVVLETGIGLFLAVFLSSYQKGSKLLRTTVLLPALMPPVTVALVWQIMLSNNYGIINQLLERMGMAPVNWLMDPATAFYAILVIDIWQYAPLAFLLIDRKSVV